ncbi:hypothetical protein PV327_007859 [Microctonus hyperodae]|uniref:Uncharacterized protein n=1 Tax=Microctonus hyperodae TaxID=165561 RepID=A0AA39KYX7_MICHY|nr:hypothetical protein PV327_007859 [Microctonus hyperodae]
MEDEIRRQKMKKVPQSNKESALGTSEHRELFDDSCVYRGRESNLELGLGHSRVLETNFTARQFCGARKPQSDFMLDVDSVLASNREVASTYLHIDTLIPVEEIGFNYVIRFKWRLLSN